MEHENKSLKYTCPMHPEIIKDAPGNCPICNMNLIPVKNEKEDQGHYPHEHGIVLVNSNPKDVANLIVFGNATYRKMIQNLIWATGYNLVALPLAAGILYQAGFMLSPAMGAVLMSVSIVVVAINARLLKI